MYKKISKDSSARYYQNNKRRLQKNAHERFQDVSEKKKNKKQEYGREWYKNLQEYCGEWYKNLQEDKKQGLDVFLLATVHKAFFA